VGAAATAAASVAAAMNFMFDEIWQQPKQDGMKEWKCSESLKEWLGLMVRVGKPGWMRRMVGTMRQALYTPVARGMMGSRGVFC
jgi:hypothetical protein